MEADIVLLVEGGQPTGSDARHVRPSNQNGGPARLRAPPPRPSWAV